MSAGGLVALSLASSGDVAVVVGVRVGGIALVLLVAALVFGWSRLLPVVLVLLGAIYATHLGLDDPPLETEAPLVGAGLLLTAELAFWSIEERDRVPTEPGEQLRRVGILAGFVLGALLAGELVLAVADAARTRGLALDLAGAGAAAAALLVVVLAARRRA